VIKGDTVKYFYLEVGGTSGKLRDIQVFEIELDIASENHIAIYCNIIL
jgi:hypothetical protein